MSRGWWDENDRFHFEAADLCKDCDAWLRAGKPPRETPTEELEPVS